MQIDFSQENINYLYRAQELASQDVELATALLNMSPNLIVQLAALQPPLLTPVTMIKLPLFVPHPKKFWWARLFTAMPDRRREEIEAVVDQAPLLLGNTVEDA